MTYNNIAKPGKYSITNTSSTGASFGSLPFNSSSSWSISFWAYYPTGTGNSSLISFDGVGTNCAIIFYNSQAGFWFNGAPNYRSAVASNNYTFNYGPSLKDTWFHLVLAISPTNIKLYINSLFYGILLNSTGGTVATVNRTSFTTNYLMTGGNTGPSKITKLSDFRIYNKQLIQSQVTTLYNS